MKASIATSDPLDALILINIVALNPWLSTHEPSPNVLDVPHKTPNRKAALTDAAAALFGQRGYHAVSVNDIACAAGVTGPAVYRHFSSKQDVLAHVLITGLEVFGEVSAAALASWGVTELVGAVASLAVDRREITALWRWQGFHLGNPDRTRIRRAGAEIMEGWSKAL